MLKAWNGHGPPTTPPSPPDDSLCSNSTSRRVGFLPRFNRRCLAKSDHERHRCRESTSGPTQRIKSPKSLRSPTFRQPTGVASDANCECLSPCFRNSSTPHCPAYRGACSDVSVAIARSRRGRPRHMSPVASIQLVPELLFAEIPLVGLWPSAAFSVDYCAQSIAYSPER
jgi:hypothetical protein